MPYTPVTSGLYTTVENTSGVDKVFGFLGKKGKRLEASATHTVPGDLVAQLGARREQRSFKALEAALKSGDLKIVSSPSVYLYDATAEATRELSIDDAVLGTVDPQWDPDGIGASDFVDNDG